MPHVRTLPALLVAALCLLPAVACGSDSSDGPASAPEPGPTEDGAFPVRIEHMFGETELTEAPARVVTVGFTDQDAVLAFDVKPVGVRDWYGEQPGATFPWAVDKFEGELPAIVGDGSTINYEAVAAQRPDVILGLYSGLEEDEYEKLSAIAPTIVQSGDYEVYAQPWQETTRMVGRALGQPERAEELVEGVERQFAEAREANPGFVGTTAAMAQFGEGSGTYFLVHPADPKADFLLQLGFEIPDEVADVIVDESNTELSFERLDLVDQELAVWLAGYESPELVAEVRDSEVYQSLAVAEEGRDLFLEDGVDALGWSTVLSLPEAISTVTPQLADTLGGDAGA